MYKLPFRLADEPEGSQQALDALPANHFLNSAPARLSSQEAFSLEQKHAAWNSAYLGGSLASAECATIFLSFCFLEAACLSILRSVLTDETTDFSFDIDVATGFMPPEPPITRLEAPWSLWEDLWESSAGMAIGPSTAGEQWRSQLRQLPVLPTTELKSLAQLRRAHLILSFLAHRYIHSGKSDTDKILPEPVARPWLQVSERLDMPTILTYADTVLYNWALIEPELGLAPEYVAHATCSII